MLIWSSPRGASLRASGGILRAHEFLTATDAVTLLDEARAEQSALLDQARRDAEILLATAHRDAREIQEQASEEARILLEQAREEAALQTERGYVEGSEEASQEWHARFAELHATHEQAMAGLERRLAAVVATAVERMVHAEPREALLRRALLTVRDTLREARTARLRVHPADAPAARAALAALENDPQAPRVQVETDAALAPGSSVFDADIGRLDTSLKVQLAGLRGALDRAVRYALEAPLTAEEALDNDGDDAGDDDPAPPAPDDALPRGEPPLVLDAMPDADPRESDPADGPHDADGIVVAYARHISEDDAPEEHDDD
ncbi:type III secretion system stator protein SctL [Acidovorax sp. NCPPB 2350]|nr:type III secretion system stator protein SctL [Acidovorax sp. NCPPB 2350]